MNWQEAGEEQGAGAPPDNPSIPPTFWFPIISGLKYLYLYLSDNSSIPPTFRLPIWLQDIFYCIYFLSQSFGHTLKLKSPANHHMSSLGWSDHHVHPNQPSLFLCLCMFSGQGWDAQVCFSTVYTLGTIYGGGI